MGVIPQEWQGAFGAPALTGACCYAIITRTSFGPSAFAFDPDKLGQINPVPATPLVSYPEDHPTLGTWIANGINLYYNQATSVAGVVFPNGTATVLFLGSNGIGEPCYGIGYPTLPLPPGESCYDPDFLTKASHAYPYKYWVWAYDANELLAVKSGKKGAMGRTALCRLGTRASHARRRRTHGCCVRSGDAANLRVAGERRSRR